MKFFKVAGALVIAAALLFGLATYALGMKAADPTTLPKFITHDFIDLSRVGSISKFRSGEGHDFSSSGESCRSMKHYFNPPITAESEQYRQAHNGLPPAPDGQTDIDIFSPVAGTITAIREEQTPIGKQVYIKPDDAKSFTLRFFHIYLASGIEKGSRLAAGQKIGVIGAGQSTDIAVERGGLPWNKGYVSYFSVMSDQVFATYQTLGVASRDALIITKEQRDAQPFTCNGEEFSHQNGSSSYSPAENNIYINGQAPATSPTTASQ
jgi:hypothetical protein